MRLRISLASENPSLRLPIQYNHLLQGLIYSNLNAALSDRLHEKGYAHGTRRFKLFTFSRLFGKRKVDKGFIEFSGSSHFYLGATDMEILGSLAEHLLKKPIVRLGSAECRVQEVGVEPEPEIDPAKPIHVKHSPPLPHAAPSPLPRGAKRPTTTRPRRKSGANL